MSRDISDSSRPVGAMRLAVAATRGGAASTSIGGKAGANKFKYSQTTGAYTQEYHDMFSRSPWITIKFLKGASGSAAERPWTEGDIATVFSQFGEVTDIRLQRSKDGRVGGRCYVCYADPQSCVLATDNMTTPPTPFPPAPSVSELGTLEVDHAEPAEIPQLAAGAQSYRQWYEATVLARHE